jgi:hypothetical protein
VTYDQRVTRICERAYDAWFSRQGSGDAAAALSVLAAFMLADKVLPDVLLKSADEEIVQGMAEAWSQFWILRPDLCACWCEPLCGWLLGCEREDRDKNTVRAAAAMARAAVKAGICDLVADDHLLDTDLLGHAFTVMRPKSARDALGEFYTPANLCEMMAAMTLGGAGDVWPGMSIAEPASGTGGMLRACAKVLREAGHDPADMVWVANDVNPLAVACLAVNVHVWGLGHNVVIGVADSLANPVWHEKAWERQCGAIKHRNELLRQAQMLALLRWTDQAATAAAAPEPLPVPARPPADPDRLLPALADLDPPKRPRKGSAAARALDDDVTDLLTGTRADRSDHHPKGPRLKGQ